MGFHNFKKLHDFNSFGALSSGPTNKTFSELTYPRKILPTWNVRYPQLYSGISDKSSLERIRTSQAERGQRIVLRRRRVALSLRFRVVDGRGLFDSSRWGASTVEGIKPLQTQTPAFTLKRLVIKWILLEEIPHLSSENLDASLSVERTSPTPKMLINVNINELAANSSLKTGEVVSSI